MTSFSFSAAMATAESSTLSLHDALPIWPSSFVSPRADRLLANRSTPAEQGAGHAYEFGSGAAPRNGAPLQERGVEGRSEEHTSELQSPVHLVCRLLLEKKKHPARDHPSC